MKETKIQWTDYTWNPWHGCKKVSDGCKFCYMYRDKERYGQEPSKVIRASRNTFNKPLRLKEKQLIFTCSWSDWFIKEADQWRNDAYNIIEQTPHLTYQILTKRAENIFTRMPIIKLDNIWLGVSIESNSFSDRAKYLVPLNYTTFVSFEPLLEDIEWEPEFNHVDWIIIGGESGNDTGKYRYRPCKLEWIESLIENAKNNNIKVFVKQLGTHLAKELKLKDRHGGNIEEFPKHLQIREMPETN